MAFLPHAVVLWPTEEAEVGVAKAVVPVALPVAPVAPLFVCMRRSKSLQVCAGQLILEEVLKFGDAHQASAAPSKAPEDGLNIMITV